MSGYIKTLTTRLEEINRLLTQRAEPKTITLDDAEKLSLFFNDYGDTNQLIDEAELIAKENLHELEQEISMLSKAIDKFFGTDLSAWRNVDFESIVNLHLKPFDDRHNKAIEEAHELWQDYYHKNNRLDYLPIDSEEYKQLDEECKVAKAKYDEAHSEVEVLYNTLRQEKKRCSSIYSFSMGWMEVLVSKINQIAEAIVFDINNLRKEEARYE